MKKETIQERYVVKEHFKEKEKNERKMLISLKVANVIKADMKNLNEQCRKI